MCDQEFVGFSCVTASGEIRHQYRTSKFAAIFTGEAMAVLEISEIISECLRESFCILLAQRPIARQRLGKQIPAATNGQAII
jgi:hypothetical protein